MEKELKDRILRYEHETVDKKNPYFCTNNEAVRYKDIVQDIRLEFQRDIDKITYSKAYTRYLGKTQVYTLNEEDHISRRSTHVQFVSRVSRTIARALGLNEDLCEAISIGHDLGHVPFGHQGERILNELSMKYTNTVFAHNVQSVRICKVLEENGKGLNLTIQVLDGILCHNGEILNKEYRPIKKDKDIFLEEYEKCYESYENIKKLVPMTLEGCVVRISDIIAYIGKDIEDAIILGNIKREDIPQSVTKILGNTNSDIMDRIIIDIVENSFNKDYISMSDEVFSALKGMLNFNYEKIYKKVYTDEELKKCKNMFYELFDVYLDALKSNDVSNDIVKVFCKSMNKDYIENTSNERIVIDYISGMTDRYMFSQYDKYCKNK